MLHFSGTYFLADTIESIRDKKWDVVFAHHLPTLVLFGAQPFLPQLKALKYASALLLIELSTPLLIRWRRSKVRPPRKPP